MPRMMHGKRPTAKASEVTSPENKIKLAADLVKNCEMQVMLSATVSQMPKMTDEMSFQAEIFFRCRWKVSSDKNHPTLGPGKWQETLQNFAVPELKTHFPNGQFPRQKTNVSLDPSKVITEEGEQAGVNPKLYFRNAVGGAQPERTDQSTVATLECIDQRETCSFEYSFRIHGSFSIEYDLHLVRCGHKCGAVVSRY